MSPLELADILEQPNAWLSIENEVAVCLRKQHEIILILRETLALALDDLPDNANAIEPALEVLKDTKEYDTSNSS